MKSNVGNGRKVVGRDEFIKPPCVTSGPPEANLRGRKAPTPRERKFVEGVAQGMTDKAAAIEAGYSLSMAENTKYKLWTKPQLQIYFQSMLHKAAPPDRILRRMSDLIDGKVVTKKRTRTFDADGKVIGETIEETETVNASTSLRATIKAAQWAGYAPTGLPEIALNTLARVQFKSETPPQAISVNAKGKLTRVQSSSGNASGGAAPRRQGKKHRLAQAQSQQATDLHIGPGEKELCLVPDKQSK